MQSSARSRLSLVLLVVAAALELGCAGGADASGAAGSGPASGGAGQASGGVSAQAGSTAGSDVGTTSGGVNSAGNSAGGSAGSENVGGMSGGNAGASAGGSGAGAGGSSGGGGSSAKVPSAGCGMQGSQALGSWVEQPKLSVKAKDRQWWVWLPTSYDPMRAYPLVFTFHGCGGPDNYPPLQKASGADAIVVRGSGSAAGGCWTYGGTSDDVLFFDAMLAAVEAQSCVDTSRVFLTGYSSGSWFTNTLECVRGDKLRATGTVSGGVVGNRGTCVGKYARIFVHDTDDTTNYFIKNGDTTKDGNYVERARLLTQNHCDVVTPPVPEDPAPCARYQGCDPGYPVIMCQTMGKMHDRQDNLAPGAFWKLFSSL